MKIRANKAAVRRGAVRAILGPHLGAAERPAEACRLRRMLFIACIQSIMLSGMTVFVIPAHLLKRMQRPLTKWLRAMLRGKACDEAPRRAMSTQEVLRHWTMDTVAGELRVRRRRWAQQWARHPEQHKQALAAMVGVANTDMAHGVERFGENGELRRERGGDRDFFTTVWAVSGRFPCFFGTWHGDRIMAGG